MEQQQGGFLWHRPRLPPGGRLSRRRGEVSEVRSTPTVVDLLAGHGWQWDAGASVSTILEHLCAGRLLISTGVLDPNHPTFQAIGLSSRPTSIMNWLTIRGVPFHRDARDQDPSGLMRARQAGAASGAGGAGASPPPSQLLAARSAGGAGAALTWTLRVGRVARALPQMRLSKPVKKFDDASSITQQQHGRSPVRPALLPCLDPRKCGGSETFGSLGFRSRDLVGSAARVASVARSSPPPFAHTRSSAEVNWSTVCA